MNNVFRVIILLALALPVASCGVKGKLKTPDQIAKEDAKKARDTNKKYEDEKK